MAGAKPSSARPSRDSRGSRSSARARDGRDSTPPRPLSVPPTAAANGSGARPLPSGSVNRIEARARTYQPPTLLGRRPWWRPPRKLRVTREGKYFIGITFGVGFAAINTGNNLLYLLLGMLLALIVVSSVMSELSLRRLTVVRRLPPRAQVGRPHLVEVEVHNHKGKIPSYAIEIEDLREGQPADKRCFFLKISPDSAQIAAYRRTPARRGRDRHIGFRIATRFPFGLFEKSRETAAEGEIIIYPATDPLQLPPKASGPWLGNDGRFGQGTGDEILGVRPMRDGDDHRDIYWRKSTLGRQLVLRERARETSRHVNLVLDSQYSGPAPDAAWLDAFEVRIREVASRAVAHIKRGDWVNVRTSAGESVSGNGSVGADPVLRFLALVEPSPKGPTPVPPRVTSHGAHAASHGVHAGGPPGAQAAHGANAGAHGAHGAAVPSGAAPIAAVLSAPHGATNELTPSGTVSQRGRA